MSSSHDPEIRIFHCLFSSSLLPLFLSLSDGSCATADDIYDKQANNQWFKDGDDLTKLNLNLQPNTKPAKNVILFLGT